jgi:site-specific recombinase XerD
MSYLRKRGKFWYIIDVKNGKRRDISLKTTDKTTAEEFHRNHETNKSRLNLGLEAKDLSIISLVEKYKADLHKSARSKERDAGTFKNFFRLCNIEKLHQFNCDTITRFVSLRMNLDKVSASTINRDLTTLKHFGAMLKNWNYTIENPADRVKDLTETETDTLFFTEHEINTIMKNVDGIWLNMFFIMINSGLRLSEVLSLRWGVNVNMDERSIMVQSPKTKRIRYVPMTIELYNHFVVMQRTACGPLVISDTKGHQPSPGVISLHWRRVLRRLKIKRPGLSLRNTRHTCATYLLAKGVKLEYIQAILGHTTQKMTQRYAKLQLGQLREAISSLSFVKNVSPTETEEPK